MSVCLSPKPLSLLELLLLTIKPINHQAYRPLSLLTIKPTNLWSSFATFKPFGLFAKNYQKDKVVSKWFQSCVPWSPPCHHVDCFTVDNISQTLFGLVLMRYSMARLGQQTMNITVGDQNLIILMAQPACSFCTGAEKWGDNGTIFWSIFYTILEKMCGFYV